MKQSIMCEFPLDLLFRSSISLCASRAYSDEDEGEEIRHGFDPSLIPPAGASEFAVGEDEEEEAELENQSNEAHEWRQSTHEDSHSGTGKYNSDMNDRHVWNSRDEHEEN